MDFDLAIIGGGVAGLSAAMYAGRFHMKVAVFDPKVGGTIMLTNTIENYPGFKIISGMQLAKNLKDHAMQYKPTFISSKVDKITKQKKCFTIKAGKEKHKAKTVIFATGTEWKKLNVKGEKELDKNGVHYCALCDGPMYPKKTLAVIGGADSAGKEALLLSNIGKKVYLIYRGEKIHPEPITLERITSNKKIEVITNTNVKEFLGKPRLEKIKLDKKYKGSDELKVDAAFIDVGHIALTSLAKDLGVKLNSKGEIKADKMMQTNIPGFYVAGDVSDTPFKQAITAASEGTMAAYSAYQYASNNPLCTYHEKPLKKTK